MFIYHTVCYFTGIFNAVVRQISMLFIDNKDSVFCMPSSECLLPVPNAYARIFNAVVRQICMLFMDNKDSVFCMPSSECLLPVPDAYAQFRTPTPISRRLCGCRSRRLWQSQTPVPGSRHPWPGGTGNLRSSHQTALTLACVNGAATALGANVRKHISGTDRYFPFPAQAF